MTFIPQQSALDAMPKSLRAAGMVQLSGMDWAAQYREVELDPVLWQRMVRVMGDEAGARQWVEGQIKLFSARQPDKAGLSKLISSMAFVEIASPLTSGARSGQHMGRVTRPMDGGSSV
jgi:hypothetical protein